MKRHHVDGTKTPGYEKMKKRIMTQGHVSPVSSPLASIANLSTALERCRVLGLNIYLIVPRTENVAPSRKHQRPE